MHAHECMDCGIELERGDFDCEQDFDHAFGRCPDCQVTAEQEAAEERAAEERRDAVRYVASFDREPGHYEPIAGSTFPVGVRILVPELCPHCGQVVVQVHRWTAPDGVECARRYPQRCDCE